MAHLRVELQVDLQLLGQLQFVAVDLQKVEQVYDLLGDLALQAQGPS